MSSHGSGPHAHFVGSLEHGPVGRQPRSVACISNRLPPVSEASCKKGGRVRMAQFLGTHQNRLDAKGRVSIPAPFRAVLKAQGTGSVGTAGAASQSRAQPGSAATAAPNVPLVLRPSHQHPCIEAWPEPAFQALAQPLDRLSQFSDEHEDLAATIYADAYPVETDKEGRIVLPDGLVAHAGLTDAVVFMGMGKTFQIWEPAAAERRRAAARERARERHFTVPGGAS
jgi:MraZ protein